MEKLWTTSEVAQYLGVSEADVEQLVRAGRLTGYKLGGKFLRFKPDQVKGLKTSVAPRPQSTAVAAGALPWQERIRDFIYFYDFYILSALLLGGVVFYLMVSS
ncbi:MAG: helix-turn-helix domain-containing protein [Candidatus Omnitrophica bacterium]|nr:helix-turn-helix domain-containing protein [Candidatus Omnitrophota bacterium]